MATRYKVVLDTATQTLTNKTLTSPVINTPTGIVKGDVGLGNVDNTSNATERAATATLANKTLTSPVFTGTVDGWIDATADAWSYASASTITVPSGAASLYQKGDRIKWTQTTVKYGVIVAVADTLLTIAVNDDYTVANAVITLNYYSHEVNPIGFPTWFAYTATITPQTGNLNDATITKATQFATFGRELHIRASITLTALGTGSPSNDLRVSYPTGFTITDAYGVGFGREIANTGIGLTINDASSTISMRTGTNTAIIVTGNSVVFFFITRFT